MPLRQLKPDAKLDLSPGSAVICVPVYGAYDHFSQCVLSLLEHTAQSIPILILDDASPDHRVGSWLHDVFADDRWPHTVYYIRHPRNRGFVENVNTAIDVTAAADVVILNSDCIVAGGWFDSLREAAYSESRVATATALTNAGTIVSVPDRNRPTRRLPDGWTVERVAAAVRDSSLALRPDLPTCVGHCVYLRRSALDLVGPFDTAFSPGYAEEVDFSQRCLLHGLRHVAADDVFVYHAHQGSFGSGQQSVGRRVRNHEEIRHRYPYYEPWVAEVASDWHAPLARSLMAATRSVRTMTVTIDGRCLTQAFTGTQIVTLDVISALDTYTDVALRVVVPPDLGAEAQKVLLSRPRIELIEQEDAEARAEPTDVVHRPYQVTSAGDLRLLPRLGRRVVITQLDTIAYRNPGYFSDFAQWKEYRRLTRAALAAADEVVFISRHGAEDAERLELVCRERVNVVYPSVGPLSYGDRPDPRAPEGAEAVAGRPFLVCLGTDFLHKNRLFAIRLLEALLEAGEFDGCLVYAGPKVVNGSSSGEEARYLAVRPQMVARVLDVGAVDEAGKLWLLQRAAAVVYPTTYEGFGLTPFDAAEMGTPTLFAAHTSLSEVLPQECALLVPWDARASARRVAPVLRRGAERQQLVQAIKEAGARFTLERLAAELKAVYAKSSASPAVAPLAVELDALQREADELHKETAALREENARLSATLSDPLNRGLVGPDAILPPELRRAVLAVAARRPLRHLATALYRAGYALRRGVRPRARAGRS